MKTLKTNITDIVNNNTFQGQRLEKGWLVVGHTDENDNWEAREVKDCEADLQQFIADLIASLTSRYSNCVSDMCNYLKVLDLESLFCLLVGKQQNSKPTISEVELEEFTGLPEMDPRLSHVMFRKLKQALKNIIWDMRQTVVDWFSVVEKESLKLKPLASVLSNQCGNLMLFKVAENQPFIEKCFVAVFESDEREHVVTLNEDAVYKSMYTDEKVYSMCGKEVCLIIDIALAKGGPESIVESYYSTMKSQQQPGGQSNDTFSLRTKHDWCLPTVLQGERMDKEVASLYIKGDKAKGLKKHKLPVLCDRPATGDTSKVIKRIKEIEPRMPFLL